MSYYSAVTIKGRMFACNRDAVSVSVSYGRGDEVTLTWDFECGSKYTAKCLICQLSMTNRTFERTLHKAKRDMRNY
jgi:hypothetical protein